jgi:hypothetical protein
MNWTKTVFHVHTHYSDDSNTSISDLVNLARQRQVGCVAVTDHDSIEGAQQAVSASGGSPKIIVGAEISTQQGHLIGLFLKECIPPGMTARETAEAIRQQQGLVVVPHPFNRMFSCSLQQAAFDIVDLIDIVEVSNSQNLLPMANRRAAQFASAHNLPALVGSDTHHRGYLDTSYQLLPDWHDQDTFLAALQQAHYVSTSHHLPYFFRSAYVVARERLGWGTPANYGERARNTRRRINPPSAIPSTE